MTNVPAGQSGTTLAASVTATGFYERIKVYDWSVVKTVTPTSLEIKRGETKSLEYTITATRCETSVTDRYGVRGKVYLTNGGDVMTQDLTIVAQVQYKTGSGQFQDLPGAYQTITPAPLPALQTGTYDYEVVFSPVTGATHRVEARVTITNHSGHLGEPFGPVPKTDFSLPNSPTVTYVDATANLNDVQTIPAGFTATGTQSFPIPLNDSATIPFTKNMTNVSVGPGNTMYLDNTAILTEGSTQQVRQNSARVEITTGTVPSGGQGGFSPGYCKKHVLSWPASYSPNQTVGSVFTQAKYVANLGSATLLQALSFSGGSTYADAVMILLRQAVAALLNASTPSLNYPLTVSQVISQVNTAIASGSRGTVLAMATLLGSYNNLER